MVIGRTLADPAPPLHHRVPPEGPALSRTLGRGTKTRSIVAGKAMRVAANAPPALMKLPMKVIAPPSK